MNVTSPPADHNRFKDLLCDPQEALDVEIKNWLDLTGHKEHKATLAKALLALANHGGGYVIIGLTETDAGFKTAPRRPATLDSYSQDGVNGIVHHYAEPAFHCAVHHVPHPTSGVIHPIIAVPGSHRVPIRAKRSGPNNRVVQKHHIYIRRPGPQSEQPLTGREWDELFEKCVRERRDELLDHIRDLSIDAKSSKGFLHDVPKISFFRMSIQEVVKHAVSDPSWVSWERERKKRVEDRVLKSIHKIISNGKLHVLGTPQGNGKTSVPEIVSPNKCRKLLLVRMVVPKGPLAPQGWDFALVTRLEDCQGYRVAEVYIGLRFVREEVYEIWPRKGGEQ